MNLPTLFARPSPASKVLRRPELGDVMPDGTLVTGCDRWPDQPIAVGARASSVDDHGRVRLWRLTGRGWVPLEQGTSDRG